MRISDLVSLNRDGNFATAIDLSAFRLATANADLCASFCFVKLEKRPVFGSWDWLRMVARGLAQGDGNIWSLTANYGHGKTHFGVVLANYFGQPWDSPELLTIKSKLASVSNDDFAQQILGWRERHQKPYLTLCLQGHQMPTLRQSVFQEVERELSRHEATRDYKAPLWQAVTIRWLDQLDQSAAARAAEWADKHGRDLGDIRKALESRLPQADFRRLCDDLASYVTGGYPPNFGHEMTARQLLDQIYADLCAPQDGPLSGIAIIFDEFHVYVDSEARHPHAGDSLQDLFEAVLHPDRVRDGSAVFIALGTMDPDEAAKRSLGIVTPDNPLVKQLNRIPKAGRCILRSELEAVLDGLLKQDEVSWEVFEATNAEPLRDATLFAYETFATRFRDELGYDAAAVKEKITKGAFPLHPITTQLLSNLKFEVVRNPRGVLEFVKEKFNFYSDQDAERDGRPNWIVANELYEPFVGMFKVDLKGRVDAALDSLGGDATSEHEQVLAAMTLVSAGSLPTPQPPAGGYARLVAEIADMDLQVAQETLDDLVARGVVDREAVSGAYRFFTGASRAQFGTALRSVRGNVRLDTYSIEALTNFVARAQPAFVAARPTDIDWGLDAEWAFERRVVTRSHIEAGRLTTMPRWNETLTSNGTKQWIRALELVFLPLSSDDVEWIRREGSDLICQAFPHLSEPPVMIVATSNPATEVEAALIDLAAADAIGHDDRAQLRDQYNQGVQVLLKKLKEAVDRYSREPVLRLVAPSLKSTMEAAGNQSVQVQSTALLKKVYAKGPSKFLSNLGLNSTSHVSGCAKLAAALLVNKADAIRTTEPNGPAMTIAEKYLRDSWGMLGSDLLLRAPTDARILDVWAHLQDHFPAGSSRELGPTLQKLANPPYGYDTCTLTLVICAWLGNQGREIQLTLDGNPVSSSRLAGDGKMGTLLGNLLRLRIKREDLGELNQRAQTLISAIESGSRIFSRAEAAEDTRVLEAFLKDPVEGWESRSASAIDTLKAHRDMAKDYAELVTAVADPSTNPAKMLERIEKVSLTALGLVREDNWPEPEQLRTQLLERFMTYWTTQGSNSAHIKELGVYSQQREILVSYEQKASRIGATSIASCVRETIARLDTRKRELESVAEQKGFAGELKGFQIRQQSLLELKLAKSEFEKQSRQLAPLAPEVQARFDSKIIEIDEEIEHLCSPAIGIEERLSQVTTARGLVGIQRDLDDLAERLKGAPEILALDDVKKKVESSIELYDSLAELEKSPPERRNALLKKIAQTEEIENSVNCPDVIKQHAKKVGSQLRSVDATRMKTADREFERSEKAIDSRLATIDSLDELRKFFLKPSEYLSSPNSDRPAALVKVIEERLATRSVEHIKSIAQKLKGDRQTLIALSKFLRDLAEEK